MTGGDWRLRAACTSGDPEAAFALKSKEQREFINTMCRPCPVRAECLADALAAEDGWASWKRFGILGGWTGIDRWRIAMGRTATCLDCPETIVPRSSLQVRCERCAALHRRAEDARRLAEQIAAGPPLPATAQVERLRPCGTRAGYERHRAAGQSPCPNCVAGNRRYFNQRRRAAA